MLKRACTMLIVLAMLALAWLAWSQLAARQLRMRMEALDTQHESLVISDLAPPIPDSQNAATYYRSAAQAISQVTWSPSNSSLKFEDYPPYPPQWHQMADQAMVANAQALALAQQARNFDQADWNYEPETSTTAFTFDRNLYPLRSLSNQLHDSVLHAHVHREDSLAIEQAKTLLHLSHALGPHSGIVGYFTARGMAASAYETLEIIAPDLQVIDRAAIVPSTQPTSPATRQAVLDLIAQLLDDRAAARIAHQAAQFARGEDFESMQRVRSRFTLLRPMVDQETARFLDYRQRVEKALDEPTWPMAEAILGEGPTASFAGSGTPTSSHARPRYSRALSSLLGSGPQVIEVVFRDTVERRVAATALAVRLYRLDHQAWPQRLDELTPTYLPQVPQDVFAPQRTPIRFVLLPKALPDGGDRPLLLFKVSNPARPGVPPATPSFSRSKNPLDAEWRDLARWAPPGQ